MIELDPQYKSYVAQKIRDEKQIPDATDDEALNVLRHTEIPDATDEEYESVLYKLYPPPAAQEAKKKGFDPTPYIIAAAGGIALGALGLRAGKRAAEIGREVKPRVELPPEIKPEVVENPSFVKPEIKTEPKIDQASVPPEGVPELPKQQPYSRILHAFGNPKHVEMIQELESNPEFRKSLLERGGGKEITNQESLAKAVEAGPMMIEDLAKWTPDMPVSTTDYLRASFTRYQTWMRYLELRFVEKDKELGNQVFNDLLTKVEPGYSILSGTPGRSLQIMNLFKLTEGLREKIDELRSVNTPPWLIQVKIDQALKEAGEELKTKDPSFVRIMRKKVEEFATAEKLTSPVTQGTNALSGGINYLVRGGERHLAAWIMDRQGLKAEAEANRKYAFGINGFATAFREMFPTGFNWESLKDSPFWKDLVADEYGYKPKESKGRGRGKAELEGDLPSVINYTLKGFPGQGLKGKIEVFKETKGPIPKKLRPLSPFRWLWAADQYWKKIIINSELHTAAYVKASEEGLTGRNQAIRIKELLEDTSKDWYKKEYKNALVVAKEYAFQEDPDRVLRPLVNFQKVPGVPIIVPFVQTPYNITKFHLQRSMFGVFSRHNWDDYAAGGIRRAQVMGRLGVGLGITGTLLGLTQLGNLELSPAWPKNKREASTWTEEHKRPWSIKIGNMWFQYNRIQPLGLYLTEIAAIQEAAKKNNFDEADNRYVELVRQLINGPMDLPFLQGMSALFDVIQDPEGSWSSMYHLAVTGFFPNILRDVRIQLDPVERKPTNVKEAINNVIPGLSTNVPERITVLGHTHQAPKNRWLRATKMFSDMTETEKTQFMNKLGWAPPVPNTKFTLRTPDGLMEAELTGELKNKFLKEMGAVAELVLDKTMSYPDIDKYPVEFIKKQLTNHTEDLQKKVRMKYQALVGIRGEKAKEKAETEESK